MEGIYPILFLYCRAIAVAAAVVLVVVPKGKTTKTITATRRKRVFAGREYSLKQIVKSFKVYIIYTNRWGMNVGM
jgi:hypothetical protein